MTSSIISLWIQDPSSSQIKSPNLSESLEEKWINIEIFSSRLEWYLALLLSASILRLRHRSMRSIISLISVRLKPSSDRSIWSDRREEVLSRILSSSSSDEKPSRLIRSPTTGKNLGLKSVSSSSTERLIASLLSKSSIRSLRILLPVSYGFDRPIMIGSSNIWSWMISPPRWKNEMALPSYFSHILGSKKRHEWFVSFL